jgi:hypothetical protein
VAERRVRADRPPASLAATHAASPLGGGSTGAFDVMGGAVMDPIHEHKEFIESFVAASPSIAAMLVREEGVYSRTKTQSGLNEFVRQLSPGNREVLAQMLETERINAFFDVLGRLGERCDRSEWRISKDGVEIPVEPFGYSMSEEYLTLLNDERGWAALS